MPGHLEPQQLSATMAQDQEGKQAIESQRRHDADVDRSNRIGMIAQKCLPGLRRRLSASREVF
jgi:hypothetical protein